jgi:hypothetical protein
MVNVAVLEDRLRATKAAKAPWFGMAPLLASALEDAAAPNEVEQLWAAAAKATGLSLQMLKRYVALWDRMRTISSQMGVRLEDLLSQNFNAQETAARVYGRSKEEGAEVMRRLAAGDITLARVRELQKRLARVSPDKLGSRSAIFHRRTVNADLIARAFKDSLVDLWGGGARLERRPRLRYIGGQTGYEVIGGDGSVVGHVPRCPIESRLRRRQGRRPASSIDLLSGILLGFRRGRRS